MEVKDEIGQTWCVKESYGYPFFDLICVHLFRLVEILHHYCTAHMIIRLAKQIEMV